MFVRGLDRSIQFLHLSTNVNGPNITVKLRILALKSFLHSENVTVKTFKTFKKFSFKRNTFED